MLDDATGISEERPDLLAAGARIARVVMYRCASNPHASAGRGTPPNSVNESSTTQVLRSTDDTVRISFRRVRRFLASQASTSRRLLAAFPASAFPAASADPRNADRSAAVRTAPARGIPCRCAHAGRHGCRRVFSSRSDGRHWTRSRPTSAQATEGCLVSLFGADVVASGQQMTGVEAHTDARRPVQPIRIVARCSNRCPRLCPGQPCARAGSSRACGRPLGEAVRAKCRRAISPESFDCSVPVVYEPGA